VLEDQEHIIPISKADRHRQSRQEAAKFQGDVKAIDAAREIIKGARVEPQGSLDMRMLLVFRGMGPSEDARFRVASIRLPEKAEAAPKELK